DTLAALHAFDEERVVGVLGDAQERRDRRQQVGQQFAAHGHERAASRQLGEFVVGGLGQSWHAASGWGTRWAACRATAARMTSMGGGPPCQISNCLAACARSISSPPSVSAPRAAASASSRVRAGLYTRS